VRRLLTCCTLGAVLRILGEGALGPVNYHESATREVSAALDLILGHLDMDVTQATSDDDPEADR